MLDNKLYYVIPAQSRVTISLLAYCPTAYAYAHVSIYIRQSEKAVLYSLSLSVHGCKRPLKYLDRLYFL